MIWSGYAFLKLRSWARTVLEFFTWFGLIYTIGFGVFWVWSLYAMSSQGGSTLEPLMVVMMIFGILMIIGFAVPLVIIIRVLRGGTVRAAVRSAA